MIITGAQVDALDGAALERFGQRISALLDEQAFAVAHDGSRVPSDPAERAALIHDLLARARGHGIRSEFGLALYAIVGIGYSRTFDEHPLARRLLDDPDHSPEHNIRRVADIVVAAESRRA